MKGFLIFNKPKNLTSFKIVDYFKKLTNDKVGHGGTLDPIAEGLLILGIGKDYTKRLNEILRNSKKVYLGEIILGYSSDTYDSEGNIKKVSDKIPDIEKINEVLKDFIGKIKQKPPKFSAIKIDGKRAYELARKGKDFDIKEKEVEIYNLEILNYSYPKLLIRAEVGSGVYIRSLANDIGERLGCGGYLNNLIREKIITINREFLLDEALSFDDIKKDFLELYAKVYGIVQGVGFRYFVYKNGKNLNLLGYVKNLEDGTVEVLAQGREKDLQKLIEYLEKGPSLAKVEKIDIIFRKPLKTSPSFMIF
ncbi:MAG: tRNA pseudouridine(55) synthase TruB [Minisyncoccia bacterium]